MSKQLTANSASQVIEFGSHTVAIDHDARTIEIYSDLSAPDRACRRDWRAVCAELRALGAKLADEMSFGRGIEVSYGTF